MQEFIVELNRLTGKKYRLPTESEWEYAAGGGSKDRTKWAGTDIESEVSKYAWYDSNSNGQTHEVATKFPNSLGLYDMSGNVWEWCGDWYGNYLFNDQNNPSMSNLGSYCVYCGGSSYSNLSGCCVVDRGVDLSLNKDYSLGFRLVHVP